MEATTDDGELRQKSGGSDMERGKSDIKSGSGLCEKRKSQVKSTSRRETWKTLEKNKKEAEAT